VASKWEAALFSLRQQLRVLISNLQAAACLHSVWAGEGWFERSGLLQLIGLLTVTEGEGQDSGVNMHH